MAPVSLRLSIQPPHALELLPAERLWPLAKEAVANTVHESRAKPVQSLDQQPFALTYQPNLVKAHTGFPWRQME